MKNIAFAVVVISLLVPAETRAGYTVPVVTIAGADIEVPYTADSANLTITAAFDGELEMDDYQLDVALAPNDGASGITMGGADEAATDYLFGSSQGWATSTLGDFQLTGSDATTTPIILADITRNIITIDLVLDLTAANIGDSYSVTFTAPTVADGTQPVIENYVPGMITVVPEPGGMALVVGLVATIGGLAGRRGQPGRSSRRSSRHH